MAWTILTTDQIVPTVTFILIQLLFLIMKFGFCLLKLYRYEYRWADGVLIKKPIEVSAPKYVEYLMDWIESQLDDESIFPQKLGNTIYYDIFFSSYCVVHLINIIHCLFTFFFCHSGAPFPPNFREVVKTIFKRLFRVYAHIYHSHFQKIVSLKEEAHLNTCFKHFILFTCVSTLTIAITVFFSLLFEIYLVVRLFV